MLRDLELKVQAGKTYAIEMRSNELDSFLELRNAGGAVVAENDDIEGIRHKILFREAWPAGFRASA